MDVPWEPKVTSLAAVGLAVGIRFSWPTQVQLENLPLDNELSLVGFGYRAEPELRELSLTFTNGVTVESLGKRRSHKSYAKLIDVEIGLNKPIGAVGVKID